MRAEELRAELTAAAGDATRGERLVGEGHAEGAPQRLALDLAQGRGPLHLLLLPCQEMASTLVIVRHGESTWNQENLFTGWHDVPLSERGRAEAAAAGDTLAAEGLWFDELHTSLLTRATQTAELALAALGQLERDLRRLARALPTTAPPARSRRRVRRARVRRVGGGYPAL